jgi:hypothetical protein
VALEPLAQLYRAEHQQDLQLLGLMALQAAPMAAGQPQRRAAQKEYHQGAMGPLVDINMGKPTAAQWQPNSTQNTPKLCAS